VWQSAPQFGFRNRCGVITSERSRRLQREKAECGGREKPGHTGPAGRRRGRAAGAPMRLRAQRATPAAGRWRAWPAQKADALPTELTARVGCRGRTHIAARPHLRTASSWLAQPLGDRREANAR